jgi:hypothetical protein
MGLTGRRSAKPEFEEEGANDNGDNAKVNMGKDWMEL